MHVKPKKLQTVLRIIYKDKITKKLQKKYTGQQQDLTNASKLD